MIYTVTNRLANEHDFTNERNPNGNTWWSTPGKPFDDASYWKRLGDHEALEQIKAEGKKVVVFVHGYNESAKTAWGVGQSIVDGLGESVTIVFYLWPSSGSLFDYEQDRKKAEESAGDLMAAMIDLECPHAICHSMGNYALQKAFELVNGATAPYVDKLAMVAADVDFDVLRSTNIAQVSGEVLVMYCDVDPALLSSGVLHGRARLGAFGPMWAIAPNAKAVDCTGILPAELLDPVRLHGDYFKDPKCWDVIWRFFQESKGVAA